MSPYVTDHLRVFEKKKPHQNLIFKLRSTLNFGPFLKLRLKTLVNVDQGDITEKYNCHQTPKVSLDSSIQSYDTAKSCQWLYRYGERHTNARAALMTFNLLQETLSGLGWVRIHDQPAILGPPDHTHARMHSHTLAHIYTHNICNLSK